MTSWFQTVNRFRDPRGAKRIAQFVDTLSRFPAGHLVDLGAGHGIFSRIAADMGWRVTAVDVRDERFPDDSKITWVVSDVREFSDYDDVDVVACLGLWYHLTLDDQLALAAKIAPRPLILDTHVATPNLPSYQQPNQYRISEILIQQGYPGRVYSEKGLEDRATASWGNEDSYWPSVASLERQMYAAGYEVFEQISPPYLPDRGFFVARGLGSAIGLDALETYVTKHDEIVRPDAPADTGRLLSFAPVVEPAVVAPKPAVTPPPPPPPTPPKAAVPPLRVAAKQFGASLRRSAKHRVRRLRQRT